MARRRTIVRGHGGGGGRGRPRLPRAPAARPRWPTPPPRPRRLVKRTLSILVTNDDGVGAPGINAVVQGLRALPHTKVTVVAPLTNQSGTGGKTTPGALVATRATTAAGYPAWAVHGYPADTITWAIDQHGISFRPDLVVSGINFGQNIGPLADDSGTVGAARAAVKQGIPALAASQGVDNGLRTGLQRGRDPGGRLDRSPPHGAGRAQLRQGSARGQSECPHLCRRRGPGSGHGPSGHQPHRYLHLDGELRIHRTPLQQRRRGVRQRLRRDRPARHGRLTRSRSQGRRQDARQGGEEQVHPGDPDGAQYEHGAEAPPVSWASVDQAQEDEKGHQRGRPGGGVPDSNSRYGSGPEVRAGDRVWVPASPWWCHPPEPGSTSEPRRQPRRDFWWPSTSGRW